MKKKKGLIIKMLIENKDYADWLILPTMASGVYVIFSEVHNWIKKNCNLFFIFVHGHSKVHTMPQS